MTLAKIGQTTNDPEPPDVLEAIAKHLKHGNREVVEAAATALGVYGDRSAAQLLIELLHDSSEGGKAVGSAKVARRTRAYAAYGLAVIGARATESSVRGFVVHHLVAALGEDYKASADIGVACVLGLGLVPLPEGGAQEDGARAQSLGLARGAGGVPAVLAGQQAHR